MSSLNLDAEALYADLLGGVRGLLQPRTMLVGIWSGGAWLADRLQADMGRSGSAGAFVACRGSSTPRTTSSTAIVAGRIATANTARRSRRCCSRRSTDPN